MSNYGVLYHKDTVVTPTSYVNERHAFYRFFISFFAMTYHEKNLLLVVWACLPVMICLELTLVVSSDDEKLIIVNPSPDVKTMNFNCHSEDYYDQSEDYDDDIGSSSGDHDNDSCICSNLTKCVCSKFEDAFNLVENNTVIAINGTIRGFTANVVLNEITNVSIIGYHKVVEVYCISKGSIEFNSCNDIIIENIAWIGCGNNEDKLSYGTVGGDKLRYYKNFHDDFSKFYFHGLNFAYCTNISIQSCTFKASTVGINKASGILCIDQVHFLSTCECNLNKHIALATGLIINQTKTNTDASVMLQITNSLFSQDKRNCLFNYKTNLLLFYILVDDPHSEIQVLVSQTNFSSISYDPGWAAENGMVWIRVLSSRDAIIKFNEVQFLSNNFQPELRHIPSDFVAMLHVTSENSGRSTKVKMESCTFKNNSANSIAVFYGDMYLDVMNTIFFNNKADSILSVTYSFRNSFITTTLNIANSTFSNNTGGQLIYLTGNSILVNMSGLQITRNVLSSDNGSLVVFRDYDNIIADINNVRYESNYIGVQRSGFSFISAKTYYINLKRKSFPVFLVRYCIPPHFYAVMPPAAYYGLNYCFNTKNFQWYSIINSSFNNNIGGEHGAVIYFNYGVVELTNNTINNCTFNNNSGYNSLIYASSNSIDVNLIVKDSTFTRNEESVFYIVNQTLQFSNDMKMTLFDGNRAQNGAALYLDLNSKVIFTNNSAVSFTNNIARRYGGAIYYEVLQSSEACYRNLSTFIVYYNASVVFNNNQARNGGNSIFFSISQACNGTLQYDVQNFILDQSVGELVTSPDKLRLYYPAQLANSSDPSTYYISDIMLGQNIIIPACVLDHYEMPLWSTQFTLQLANTSKQSDYSIQGNDIISVDCRILQGINNLVITGKPPLINSIVTIQLNSFYDIRFNWKPITVILDVQLSSCHSGFYYSSDLEYCVCYTTDNIVTCSGSNSTIRNGYWFGTINEQPTVTVCPINYCNFDNCEATTGTCDLYPLRDNQCRAHRSGAACGNCEEGYTLSFDSIDCISMDSCNVGQTVLVITMSFLYWIAVIAVVFGLMYFKIKIGYLYGITFYYSIIDIILKNALLVSDSLYQLVTTLASFSKLLPQFLGRLCFVKGLSGIDQQFIHYLHPFAILLILWLISLSARFSHKISSFLSRAVIHAICLLLLLSYSSIASTSLLLVRAIRFTSVDKVYSYLSPDIEYFHGRHLAYGLIALVIGLIFVIGLPLLLLLEPFVNSKINFIKIKPLLDQFQGCYKDRFHYFASFLMLFRLMILSILAINETDPFISSYLLLVMCQIMILIYITVRPYNNNVLNFFDSFMLLVLVLVITLEIIVTYSGVFSNTALAIAFVLVILPLLVFVPIVLYFHVKKFKKVTTYCISVVKSKIPDTTHNKAIEMQQCEHTHEVIVDQELRDKINTTVV